MNLLLLTSLFKTCIILVYTSRCENNTPERKAKVFQINVYVGLKNQRPSRSIWNYSLDLALVRSMEKLNHVSDRRRLLKVERTFGVTSESFYSP